jgi:hypothetical protein
MYSASDARKELAEYKGIKQLPRENDDKLRAAVKGILTFLEKYPDYDMDKVVATFSEARHLDFDFLRAKVLEAKESVH